MSLARKQGDCLNAIAGSSYLFDRCRKKRDEEDESSCSVAVALVPAFADPAKPFARSFSA